MDAITEIGPSRLSLSPSLNQRKTVPRGRKSNGGQHRLNVLFSNELNERLLEVQRKTHAQTLADVFRNALVVYAHLLAAHERGDEFIIRSDDGKEKILQLFL
ncbi:MAG TPA: hypothetical protein VF601_02865 [Beijerinckiaceae bacterium]